MALFRLEMNGSRADARSINSQRKRMGGPCLLGCEVTPKRSQWLAIAGINTRLDGLEKRSMLKNMEASINLHRGRRCGQGKK